MWKEYDKKKVPIGILLLFEVENRKGRKEYHTGTINRASNDSVLGHIGGRFHFDYHKVNRYRTLEDILP